jgi:hemerythrin-like metal-binding protein
MDIFNWNGNFKAGLRTVDDQHHGAVDLINDLGRSITSSSGATKEQIDDIFHELMLYTQYHFDEKEHLMLEAEVDKRHVQVHLEAHRHFVEELNFVCDIFRADYPSPPVPAHCHRAPWPVTRRTASRPASPFGGSAGVGAVRGAKPNGL